MIVESKRWLFAVFAVVAMVLPLASSLAGERENRNCSQKAMSSDGLYDFPGCGYWMQFGGDRYLSYTGDGGTDSKMYDTVARRQVPMTSQNVDAAILPEGDLYVHPDPIRFYRTKDAIRKGDEAKPVYTDEDTLGNYQSIGVTGRSGNARRLRILVGSNSTVREYSVKQNGDHYNIQPQGDGIRICGNMNGWRSELRGLRRRRMRAEREGNDAEVQRLDRELRDSQSDESNIQIQTPVISRDGSMIAARDYNAQVTNIVRLQMPSGNCSLVATIPSETDKVQFSYDNKRVLYVVQDRRTTNGRLIEMEIGSGKKRVLSGPDEDVMYQGYKPDGTIMYSRRAPRSLRDDDDGYGWMRRQYADSELVMLNPNTVPFDGTDAAKKFAAIGRAWATACEKSIDDNTAVAVGSRLNAAACREAFSDSAKTKQAIGSYEIGALKSLCLSSGRDRHRAID